MIIEEKTKYTCSLDSVTITTTFVHLQSAIFVVNLFLFLLHIEQVLRACLVNVDSLNEPPTAERNNPVKIIVLCIFSLTKDRKTKFLTKNFIIKSFMHLYFLFCEVTRVFFPQKMFFLVCNT